MLPRRGKFFSEVEWWLRGADGKAEGMLSYCLMGIVSALQDEENSRIGCECHQTVYVKLLKR